MKLFSVWAGVKFLGVFSDAHKAQIAYNEYEFAIGAEDCGDMIVFESILDDYYDEE